MTDTTYTIKSTQILDWAPFYTTGSATVEVLLSRKGRAGIRARFVLTIASDGSMQVADDRVEYDITGNLVPVNNMPDMKALAAPALASVHPYNWTRMAERADERAISCGPDFAPTWENYYASDRRAQAVQEAVERDVFLALSYAHDPLTFALICDGMPVEQAVQAAELVAV